MPDADGEATSLEVLADYECPECGEMVDLDLTETEALLVLGGDESGTLRCPNDWCGEELEVTLDASVEMLRMVAERRPDLAPQIAEQLGPVAEQLGPVSL
ncbi:MAG TPA: hypothetical protein VGB14_15940 [Acidimicrobiales bacterium]|jgi:hypothetical protein